MKTPVLTFVLLLLIAASAQPAVDSLHIGGLSGIDPVDSASSYSVLLALSGGGARGLSAIGVLKAFEEKHLKVRALGGTSMGGIVGGLYACGYSADELGRLIQDIDFSALFSNNPERSTILQTRRADRDRHLIAIRFDHYRPYIPQGLTAAQKITALLTSLTNKANYLADGDYTQFPIPFLTVSTDIVSGSLVVQTGGSLADDMRASMAFPLAFTAVEEDSMLLMDGGMVAPVPVEQVRTLTDSVDYVVAINTTSPLVDKDELVTPIDIANQVTTIMTRDQLTHQLAQADFVIEPPISAFTSADFDNKQTLIDIGYQAGLEAADSIISQLQSSIDRRKLRVTALHFTETPGYIEDQLWNNLEQRVFTRREVIAELKRACRQLPLFEIHCVIRNGEPPADSVDGTTPVLLDIRAVPAPTLEELEITIDGNTIYDDSTLIRAMALPEDHVTAVDLQRGIDRVVNQYAVDGYDLADVSSIAMRPDGSRLAITIDEGFVYRVDVLGNERSRDWFVRSYFTLDRGDPYSTERAMRGVSNIYGTDLYDRVTINLLRHPEGVIVRLGVVEKRPTQLRFGWHWVDEYQSEQFVELVDDNVLGIGVSVLGHARFGKDRWHYYSQVKTDRIFSTYLTALIGGYYRRVDRPLFDLVGDKVAERREEKYGLQFQLGQQIARLGAVSGTMSFAEARWRLPDGSKETIGLRSLHFESLVETFDRFPFPNTGNKYLFSLQLTGKLFGGEVEFTRYFSSLETYLPIGNYLTYHPKLSIGISRSGLPPTEKFYTGGMYAFNGYQNDELSGDKIFLVNQELRIRLPLRLYLSARYDFGDVYTSTDNIKLENLRQGLGFSAAWDSPLGPVELGWGHTDDHNDQMYFRAGLAF